MDLYALSRHDVFAETNKKELEQLVKESKEFKYLWEERDRNKAKEAAEKAAASSGGAGTTGGAAGAGVVKEEGPGGKDQQHVSARSDGLQVRKLFRLLRELQAPLLVDVGREWLGTARRSYGAALVTML